MPINIFHQECPHMVYTYNDPVYLKHVEFRGKVCLLSVRTQGDRYDLNLADIVILSDLDKGEEWKSY